MIPRFDSLNSPSRTPACHLHLKDVLYIHVYLLDVKSTRLVTLSEERSMRRGDDGYSRNREKGGVVCHGIRRRQGTSRPEHTPRRLRLGSLRVLDEKVSPQGAMGRPPLPLLCFRPCSPMTASWQRSNPCKTHVQDASPSTSPTDRTPMTALS